MIMKLLLTSMLLFFNSCLIALLMENISRQTREKQTMAEIRTLEEDVSQSATEASAWRIQVLTFYYYY